MSPAGLAIRGDSWFAQQASPFGLVSLLGSLWWLSGQTIYNLNSISYNDWGFVEFADRDDVINASFSYDYGGFGELDSYVISQGATSRLIDYSYDSRGNVLSHSGMSLGSWTIPARTMGTYDSNNHVIGDTYDNSGRRTADALYRYLYNDGIDRVRAVDRVSDNLRRAEFAYNALGQRVRAVEDERVTFSFRDIDGRLLTQLVSEPDGGGNCGERWSAEDYFYLNNKEVASVVAQVTQDNGVAGNFVAVAGTNYWINKLRDELGAHPERWVTNYTGHMGNTFRLSPGGTRDALEGNLCDGRENKIYWSASGWRFYDSCV